MENSITDVTDTARWVAAVRAAETLAPRPAFRDPLASRLAGPRGAKIAASFPQSALVSWGIVTRTSAIDRLVLECVAGGVDTVVNLGAGMDTRPYRLELPAGLRWFEVDLPSLVQHKETLLSGATAGCELQRVAVDLREPEARRECLAACGARSRHALLLAEGLIPYLATDTVRQLAADCAEIAAYRHWILDFDNAGVRKLPRAWQKRLRAAPIVFQAADWFEFFASCGWTAQRVITSGDESRELQRAYPGTFPLGLLMRFLPDEVRQRILAASGAALLQRRPGI